MAQLLTFESVLHRLATRRPASQGPIVTWLWAEGKKLETWGAPDAPAGFLWLGVPHAIVEVCNRWRVHTRWWEPAEAVWHEYLKVTTDSGFLCLIYRDLTSGGWYLSRIYD